MDCRQIYFTLSQSGAITTDKYTMVDEYGNYVFYGLSSSQLTSGTFSVGLSASNFNLTSFTQSGAYSPCYNPPYDGDASAFILATQIATSSVVGVTPSIIIPAVHRLVIDLKSNGIWNKLYAIYPFVGATANSHKYNLKDPRDLDAAFRLTFTGGFTHSPTGIITSPGSGAQADTKLIPSSTLGSSNVSLSYYTRQDLGATNMMAMGAITTNRLFFYLRFNASNATLFDCYGTSGGFRATSALEATNAGYYIVSRTSTTDSRIYKNGTQSGSTQTTSNTNTQSTSSIILFTQPGNPTLDCFVECAFATIGDGLTPTESSILNTIVETFQDSLSRGTQ